MRAPTDDEFVDSIVQEIVLRCADLNTAQLLAVQDKLTQIIGEDNKRNAITKILQEIQNKGYACSSAEYNDNPKFEVLTVSYKVHMRAYDKNDFNDCHVTGSSYDQDPWVSRLNFVYRPTDNDDWDVSGDKDHWDYGDWDSPATCIGAIPIYIYYQKVPCPPEGSKFDSISEDGEVDHWEITDSMMLCNGKVLATTEKWDDHDILVLLSN